MEVESSSWILCCGPATAHSFSFFSLSASTFLGKHLPLYPEIYSSIFPSLLCIQRARLCELRTLGPFANWSIIMFNQGEALAGNWGAERRESPFLLSALGWGSSESD